MVRVFAGLGIRKVRLTGGEPLLRAGLVEFVRELARLHNSDGHPLEIAITTNGHLLAELAQPLKDAGLTRVTVSMDGVNEEKFAKISRVQNAFAQVLAGVRAAKLAGLEPVKVNCVLLRGFNDDQIEAFGEFARDEGVIVRFIEFMPLEEDRVWSPDVVVRMDEIVARLSKLRGLREVPRRFDSETARRFVFTDGVGEIGIVAPVSDPFCHHCSRVRVTSDGKVRTCLFSVFEHDLAAIMRSGATDAEMAAYVTEIVTHKEERHHIGEKDFVPASRTMVHIGG